MPLVEIGRRTPKQSVGRKAEGLHWLASHGYPTPKTWAVPWDAYVDPADEPRLVAALERIVEPQAPYAVRSSANLEDEAEHSFAGQFTSVLDVTSAPAIARAVHTVREQATSASVRSYLSHEGIDSERLRMGVIVQEMVDAVYAGVAFSANPMTALDEIIVEAVEGSGEALVQDGVTPERWTRKWGAWTSRPVSPVMPEDVAATVADLVASVGDAWGYPVDVEWVWDGERVVLVQVREITTIDSVNFYANRIAREVLPGVISPLVWSVNVPLVNGAWIRLLEEMVGPTGLEPDDLARPFYYRAYFNMGALGRIFDIAGLPRETLELLMLGTDAGGSERPRFRLTLRSLLRAPRATAFGLRNLRLRTQVNRRLPELEAELRLFLEGPPPADLTAAQVFDRVDQLGRIVAEIAYLNIVTPLASAVYNRLFERALAPLEIDFEEVDFGGRDAGTEGRDPGAAFASLHAEWEALPSGTREAVSGGKLTRVRSTRSGVEFLAHTEAFLAVYGHFSDSGNDFAAVPWREDIPLVLRMAAAYEAPPAASGRADRIRLAELDASPRVLRAYDRAAAWQVLRERVSSLYTLAYGHMRPLYRRVGDILVRRTWFEEIDDVFMLTDDELRAAASFEMEPEEVRTLVATRRAEMEEVRDAIVPDLIFGEEEAPLAPPEGTSLAGVPTSPGYVSGPARRVTSAADVERVHEGDVLVVPYSDVGWTPLFARAAGVIAESGGFLSHSSIIAREYGIPAVVSVDGAMQRISDGAIVAVDGYTGAVTIVDEPDEDAGGVGAAS